MHKLFAWYSHNLYKLNHHFHAVNHQSELRNI